MMNNEQGNVMILSNRILMIADFIGPVNIGNPNEFTIRQLAEMTIELTHSTSKIV